MSQPRRSPRLSEKPATITAPKASNSKKSRTVAKPQKNALLEAYKAGDRSTPELRQLHEVIESLTALSVSLSVAKTIEDLKACLAVLDGNLYQRLIDFDLNGRVYFSGVKDYVKEALIWLEWEEKFPEDAAEFKEAYNEALNSEDIHYERLNNVYYQSPKYLDDLFSDSAEHAINVARECMDQVMRNIL